MHHYSDEDDENRAEDMELKMQVHKLTMQRNDQLMKLQQMNNENIAKERDLAIIKNRVKIETNELNNLNYRIELINRNKDATQRAVEERRKKDTSNNMNANLKIAKLHGQVSNLF